MFWATIRVLLWLSEFCEHSQELDRSAAVEVVLEKTRTALNAFSLDINAQEGDLLQGKGWPIPARLRR